MPRRKVPDTLETRRFTSAATFDETSKRRMAQEECVTLILSAEGVELFSRLNSVCPASVAVVKREIAKLVRKAEKKGLL